MDKTKFRGLIGAIAVGATAVFLAACSGDDGAPGPAGPPGAPGAPGQQGPAGVITVTVPGNTTAATGASTAAWAALAPKASVTSVSISSPQVVNFTVTTQDGTPIVGLGSTSKRLAATKPGYTNLSGTSMAAPLVAGLCALIRSAHPGMPPAQVKALLESTAADLGDKGFDKFFGNGRIDAKAALLK